ncbi:MAG: hypothetical protein QXG03_07830 [Halalkalicoccus sp.]
MRTHVERVDREREAVIEKRTAYDRFRTRLGAISPRRTGGTGGDTLVSSGGTAGAGPVREAFAETVAPTCEDRPVSELLAAELGEEVATALATAGLSPPLYRALESESGRRRAELAAMERALDAEADSLERASDRIEPIRKWLIETNETPLSACEFDELRARHERLAGFRADCGAIAVDRQEHLGRTTSAGGRAGVRHRDLPYYLYESFPTDHPVLVTVARLDDLCGECQRVVRSHLVRRV